MERRCSQRKKITFSVDAKLISDDKSYDGFIENISQYGIKWYLYDECIDTIHNTNDLLIKTAPSRSPIDFIPGTKIELKLL